MLNSQNSIHSIIEKWELVADQSHCSIMIIEMEEMFSEFLQKKINKQDIIRVKDKILRAWVCLSWADAKKRNPQWKNKEWWQNRKDLAVKIFSKYYNSLPDASNDITASESKDEVFDNVEDMLAWGEKRKQRIANGNG